MVEIEDRRDLKPPKEADPNPYEPADPAECARRLYHLLGALWGKAETGLKRAIEQYQRHAQVTDSVLAANGSTFPISVVPHAVNPHYSKARHKGDVLCFYIGDTLLRLYTYAREQTPENHAEFEKRFARLRSVIRHWPQVVVYGSDPEGYRLLTEPRAVKLLRKKFED